MPRNPALDPYSATASGLNSPARSWYVLQAAHIGAQELPLYARALRVRLGPAVAGAVTLVVVPIGEPNDAATTTINVDATELLPFGVRRIVSVNGAATLPAGVDVDLITD